MNASYSDSGSKQPSKRPCPPDGLQETIHDLGKSHFKRRRVEQEDGHLSPSKNLVRSRQLDPAREAHEATELPRRSNSIKSNHMCWTLSDAIAGRISDLDTVFTPDEKYIFIGSDITVQVLSLLSPAQPVRTLRMKESQKVIGFKLSPLTPEHLYISTLCGTVGRWDWISGKQISVWKKSRKAISFNSCSVQFRGKKQVLLFFVQERQNGSREISVSPLDENASGAKLHEFVILRTTKPILSAMVVQGGQVLAVSETQNLFIGHPTIDGTESITSIVYTWTDVTLPVKVTSLDLRENPGSSPQSAAQPNPGKGLRSIDLVLGERGGSILICNDILNSVVSNNGKVLPVLRKLHWHREAVNVVRWSKDGNYIISGGEESVLVLWQLDSGRKSFLPHLSSPICNAVVSPTGKLYAIKLADNSLIVLSAAEYRSIASIISLQLPLRIGRGNITQSAAAFNVSWTGDVVPAVIHPRNPDLLLLGVPTRESLYQQRTSQLNLSVLQTFDVRNGCHISRQALSRTNTTVLTHSPEGTEISTPDIQFLELSWDGRWLMSIDSWSPDAQDVGAADSCRPGYRKNPRGCEVCLKFWRWDEATKAWELSTRIDAPHFRDSEGTVSVLGAASRPDGYEFATIGGDGILRFWNLIGSHNGAAKMLPTANNRRQTWSCRNAMNLNGMFGEDKNILISAPVGFSEDGSVLAVCLQAFSRSSSCSVYLISTDKHHIHRSHEQLVSGKVCAAKFLGRCLIIASTSSVSIWDTVDDVSRGTINLGPKPLSMPLLRSSGLFAVSPKAQAFAMVTTDAPSTHPAKPTKRGQNANRYHVEVYCVHSLTVVSRSTLTYRPLALLSDPKSSNFVIVDAAANLRQLRCLSDNSETVSPPSPDSSHSLARLDNLFRSDPSRGSTQVSSSQRPAEFDQNPPASLPRHIATLFNNMTSTSFPPVSTMFRSVVNLFSTP